MDFVLLGLGFMAGNMIVQFTSKENNKKVNLTILSIGLVVATLGHLFQ